MSVNTDMKYNKLLDAAQSVLTTLKAMVQDSTIEGMIMVLEEAGVTEEKGNYEVIGYATSSDFDAMSGVILEEYVSKDIALSTGKEALGEYYKVKIQSVDREEILILTIKTFTK